MIGLVIRTGSKKENKANGSYIWKNYQNATQWIKDTENMKNKLKVMEDKKLKSNRYSEIRKQGIKENHYLKEYYIKIFAKWKIF